MNKDLYIKKKETNSKYRELRSIFHCLKEFMKENEKIFKRKESIEALKSIKEYLIKIENEVIESGKECEKIHKELARSCNHEVAIKGDWHYQCLVCKRNLGENIPKESLISIDRNKDYMAEDKLYEILEDIVHSDKDLVETLNDLLEELQYDSKIKVYRR